MGKRGNEKKGYEKNTGYIAALLMVFILCSCGAEQNICVAADGIFSCNGQLYKNDGEIFLSEEEREYVRLVEEIPEGIKGAELYTSVWQYEDWLLLGLEESQVLPGLEGYRYFLLLPDADTGRAENGMADGMMPQIYYNGGLYQYERGMIPGNVTADMETIGFVRSFSDGSRSVPPDEELQASLPVLLGHLVFRYGDGLLISADGGKTYSIYALAGN